MNIAFIPARGGSKSIPLKNIKEFCGRPLIFWTLKALVESESIDKIVVATDSQDIMNCVVNCMLVLGPNRSKVEMYQRKPENAQDESTTESVMLEYINQSGLNPVDNFVLVQCTNPFLKSSDIDNGIRAMGKGSGIFKNSVISVSETNSFAWDCLGQPMNYDPKKRPRRQEFFDHVYLENGSFYISTIENIVETKNRITEKPYCYKMPAYTAFEIDEPIDWIICESIFKAVKND